MQATTPTDPRVVEEMLPYFTEYFGNPHSRTHQFGWESEEAVEVARKVRLDRACEVYFSAERDPRSVLEPVYRREDRPRVERGTARSRATLVETRPESLTLAEEVS
jgi:hypothetical protein